MQRADEAKKRGNDHFSAGRIDEALTSWKQSVDFIRALSAAETSTPEAKQLLVACLSNSSQACLGRKQFVEALQFADEALKVDPRHEKSLSRRLLAEEGVHADLRRMAEQAKKDADERKRRTEDKEKRRREAEEIAQKKDQCDKIERERLGSGPDRVWSRCNALVDELMPLVSTLSLVHGESLRLCRVVWCSILHIRRRYPTFRKDAYFTSYLHLLKDLLGELIIHIQQDFLRAGADNICAFEVSPVPSEALAEKIQWVLGHLLDYGVDKEESQIAISSQTVTTLVRSIQDLLGGMHPPRVTIVVLLGAPGSGKLHCANAIAASMGTAFPRKLCLSWDPSWALMSQSQRFAHCLAHCGFACESLSEVDEAFYALHVSSVSTHIVIQNVAVTALPPELLSGSSFSLETVSTMWRAHPVLSMSPFVKPDPDTATGKILLTILADEDSPSGAVHQPLTTMLPTTAIIVQRHRMDPDSVVPLYAHHASRILEAPSKSIPFFRALRERSPTPLWVSLLGKCATLRGDIVVDDVKTLEVPPEPFIVGAFLGQAISLLRAVVGFRPITIFAAVAVLNMKHTECVELFDVLSHLSLLRSSKSTMQRQTSYHPMKELYLYEREMWWREYWLSRGVDTLGLVDPPEEELCAAQGRYQTYYEKLVQMLEGEVRYGARRDALLLYYHMIPTIVHLRVPTNDNWSYFLELASIEKNFDAVVLCLRVLRTVRHPSKTPLDVQDLFPTNVVPPVLMGSHARHHAVVARAWTLLSELGTTKRTEIAQSALAWVSVVEPTPEIDTLWAQLRLSTAYSAEGDFPRAMMTLTACSRQFSSITCGMLPLSGLHAFWSRAYHACGNHDEALQHAVHSLECCQRVAPVIPTCTVDRTVGVARALLSSEKPFEMQTFIDRALGVLVYEAQHGISIDERQQAMVLYYFAKGQFRRGEYGAAEKSLREALSMAHCSVGLCAPLTAKIYILLARCCAAKSPVQTALLHADIQSLFQKARTIVGAPHCLKIVGSSARSVGVRAPLRQAATMWEGGDAHGAEGLCYDVLWDSVGAGDSFLKKPESSMAFVTWWMSYTGPVLRERDVLRAVSVLSGVYHSLGEASNAQLFARASHRLVERLYPTVRNKFHLQAASLMSEAVNGIPEGLEWATKALSIARQLYGDEHEATLRAMNGMGWALEQLHKLSAAHTLHTEAYDILHQGTIVPLPCRLSVLTWYGVSLIHKQDYAAGITILRGVYDVSATAFGTESIQCAAIVHHIAAATYHLGKLQEAKLLYMQSLKTLQSTAHPRNPLLPRAMTNLAMVVQDMFGDPAETIRLLTEALRCRMQSVYCTPLDVAASYSNLGFCYYRQKKYRDTIDAFHDCLRLRESCGVERSDPLYYSIDNWIKLVEQEEEEDNRLVTWSETMRGMLGMAPSLGYKP